MQAEPGQRVVVRTPDRREFRGQLLEIRITDQGSQAGVVKLDTGWVTTYPMSMVHREDR
jgi:hypothetical protein